jgi:glycosyltransferase involved in cell wall biosynthesis
MHIGIDACSWSNKRGYGRFTRELLKALITIDQENEYIFFVDKDTATENAFPTRGTTIVAPTLMSPTQAASASGRRSLRDVWALSKQVIEQDLDLFFFPTSYSYFPIFNRAKVILTIHDMIGYRHPDMTFASKKQRFFWTLKHYLAVRQADLILTVSEHSEQEILQYYNLPKSRIHRISEAANSMFTILPRDKEMAQVLFRYQLDLDQRFLLYVGGISPNKNLKTLVDVYDRLIMDPLFSDLKLVLVGNYKNDPFHSNYPSLKQHIERLGLEKKVIFTGFIEDQELIYFYNAASLLVFPSFDEGFGLPAIEAMACGTPVVSSDRGSLPEVLGEAGRFFDPCHPETMLKALQDVLSSDAIQNEMKQKGLIRSQQFTWENAARKLISLFTGLVGTPEADL